MAYVKLEIPPGVVRAGTQYDSRGRWYDTQLVRWWHGALQPWGGWTVDEAPSTIGSSIPLRPIARRTPR